MKIAILTPTFSKFSGIDRVVELQAKDFIRKGYEVTIICLNAGMNVEGVKIIELGMPKNSFLERVYRLFFFLDVNKIKNGARILKKFDITISHMYPMNLIALKAKKKHKVKYVYHNHGVATPKLFSNFFERSYMKLFNLFSNKSIRKCNQAVSISDYLRKVLKRETGMDSRIEYDKIDVKRFHKKIKGTKIRKKYGLRKNPVLLYVGRISPHKGIDLLIKSFNLVLREIPNAKLLIVGKPTFDKYFKELKKLANENVIFTGFVEDEELPYYYAACDVYTTATLWEGFNMTVVEAQAVGKPVVAFDLGPHPEVVKKGVLVKPKDIKMMASAILKTLK